MYETKTFIKHSSCDCKCKFNSTTCNSNLNWIAKHVNVNVKIIVCEKNMVGIQPHVFVRMVCI